MSADSHSDRRDSFRLMYPAEGRPLLVWKGEPASVLDCSERGFRVEAQSYADCPKVGDLIEGSLVFHDGTRVAVRGVVRHVRHRVAGVNLEAPGVPGRVLMAEQLRLRRSQGWAAVR